MIRAVGQRLFFTFFLGIVAMGGWTVFPSAWKGFASHRYAEARCTLRQNEFAPKGSGTSRLVLTYAYEFGGRTYEGTGYRWGFDKSSQERTRETRGFVRRHEPGDVVPCFVNPSDPRESVIVKGGSAAVHEVVLLFLFVLIGIAGFLVAVFRPDLAEDYMIMDGDTSGGD